MRNRRWNRFVAGTLVAALIFANSMTVLAYRDGYNEILSENASQEQIENMLDDDVSLFAPDETEGEFLTEYEEDEIEEILYDRQFVDEEGNIYMVPDVEPHWGCDHSYVSGKDVRHDLKSDGSCEVTVYKAERCSKCGTVKIGDLISITYYPSCPH